MSARRDVKGRLLTNSWADIDRANPDPSFKTALADAKAYESKQAERQKDEL